MQVLLFTIGQIKLMCSIEHISCIVELDESKISSTGITYHRGHPVSVVRGWDALKMQEVAERYMLVLDGGAQIAVTVTDVLHTDVVDLDTIQFVHGQQVGLIDGNLVVLVFPSHFGCSI